MPQLLNMIGSKQDLKRKISALEPASATRLPVFAQVCKDKLPGVAAFKIAGDGLSVKPMHVR